MIPFTVDRFIPTERLTLRPLADGDLADVAAYQSIPGVVKYLPWPLRTLDESREHLAKRKALTRLEKNNDAIVLAAELDGRVIGDFTFILKSIDNKQGEIGWVLHPDFQGKGFALEGATAVLDLAFDSLGMHRMAATLDARNHSSAALCARLGMRREAHFVQEELFKGEWVSTEVWAILDREWAARR